MEGVCQARFHSNLPQRLFNLISCSQCYQYLFPKSKDLISQAWFLVATDNSKYKVGTKILADITNSTFVKTVCNTLSLEGDCDRWKDCCNAAIKCCEQQLATPLPDNGTSYCPRIWDGYGCFTDTLPGSRAYIQCPSYIEYGVTHANAYKDCTENGTWYVDPLTNKTWTNYTSCVPLQHPLVVVYISLACNVVSLLLLVPSCAIFLAFKQLRSQHRIKLHICFFTSFILVSVVAILFDVLIHHNRFSHKTDSALEENSAWCKVLFASMRYTQTSNYFWMFCEGFYLHRLIVHAFKVPKGLLGYYVMGWGVSMVPVIIYSILRATDEDLDKRCWVPDAGHYEWIIFTPNLLCLFLNVVFFCYILRILLTQLQSHPNEPSNYRRALKATFVLIPLFGIQWALVIHRPEFNEAYEIVRVIVQYTQGAIVSLVFCIFNGEVHSHLKNYLRKKWPSAFRDDPHKYPSTVSGTQYSHVSSGRRGTQQTDQFIPLTPVADDKEQFKFPLIPVSDDKVSFKCNGYIGK